MASEFNLRTEQRCQDTKPHFDILFYTNFTLNFIKICFVIVSSNFKAILLGAILIILLFILYKSYCSPVLYKKELSEIGYSHLPKKDRTLHLIRAQNNRKFGSKLPPPYPNGWFSLVESQDLGIGDVVPVDALGLNFCVYRGEDGKAQIVDAYCPHLGANMAMGGSVSGDCIQCPFHEWRFKNGACVSIPGLETVPKGISIKSYPCMEVDGSVWVWYHASGEPPLWSVPERDTAESWHYRGRNEFLVSAHIQEIPENGADVAHLNPVHTVSMFSDVGLKYPFLNQIIGHHTWGAEWTRGDEEHLANITISQKYIIMKMDVFPLKVTVDQIGPAHVRLNFMSPLGPMTVSQSVTPLAPLLQKVVHRVYSPWYNAPLGAALVLLEAKQELSEIGYSHLPKKDRTLHLIRAQNNRKFGSKLPPPYPNGWFSLVESQDLGIGDVVPVDALGLNFCVYRGEDGKAQIVDAYCPHLGANMAMGGSVSGDCIQCPFHEWRFKNGACVSIPGLETVPKGISIKSYPCMEVDGSVWVWYHASGEPPLWSVPERDTAESLHYRGRNEFLVSAHIQEIPENGADVAHLNPVHTVSMFSDVGLKYPFLNQIIGHHTWGAEWTRGDEEHLANITISQKYIIMKMDVFPLKVTVDQIGPAHVRLNFMSPLGPMTVSQSVTPLAPLLQKVVHRVYSPWYNAPLGAALVLLEAKQFQRDVAIWNNKRYVASPAYTKTDKTIRTFRAWFSQFYSKDSVSMRDAMQNPLDW